MPVRATSARAMIVIHPFRPNLLAAIFGVLAVLLPSGAWAQNEGFALNRFDVSEVGSDWFAGDSLDMRGKTRPGVRLVVDWAHKPLVRYDEDGNELDTVIEDQLYGYLGAGIILFDRLRLAANMPLLVLQRSNELTVGSQVFGPEQGAALGDLRLAADVRLAGKYGGPATVAIGAQLHLPTGDRSAFAGDGAVRLVPRLMLAGDLGPLAYSTRVSFNYRPSDDGFGTVSTGSEIAFVATAGIRAIDGRLLIGPELWGSTVLDAAFEKATTPFEILGGIHYRVGDFSLGAGAGPGLNRGLGAPQVRVVGLLEFIPDASDRDEDGILDKDDACPDVPGPPNDDARLHGCPDRDGDRIIDPDDACPDVPGTRSDDPSKNGCPDRDGDGIIDPEDACPDAPGPRSDDPSKNGCPDRDGDGIIDSQDACPDDAGPPNDDPRKNGCPDRDGDGIIDPQDACPDVPGVANPDPAKHGCPIAAVVKDEIKIYQRIEFETDKAKIRHESEVVLRAVLDVLVDHPEIKAVRVEGHTDNVGAAKYNYGLSKRRAASVVAWLVEHGIDRQRLFPEGFGLERPIASNSTPVGRQKNRRVEFHITSRDASKAADDSARSNPQGTGDNDDEDDDDPLDL